MIYDRNYLHLNPNRRLDYHCGHGSSYVDNVVQMKNQGPSDTYRIVQIILRRGNAPGLIAEWFDGMRQWAQANSGQDAEAVRLWLSLVEARPFYTAKELARFWPALRLTLGMTKRLEPAPSPHRLANELEFWGLPYVRRSDGVALKINGEKYFIVDRVHHWSKVCMNEAEIGEFLK